MSLSSLLVVVPTRGRKANCERLLTSFTETATVADITFITDPDDQDTYAGMDWGPAMHAVLDPRGTVVGKLNHTALACADAYDAMMNAGDDCVFKTPGWDAILLDALDDMGGSGIVYPDDKRRADVPELWCASSDVVKTLGYFAMPGCAQYYVDNCWAELGKRSALLRYVPEAVVEHLHHSVIPETEHDEVYRESEGTWGAHDLQAYQEWLATLMPIQVSWLRREYNPDIRWLLEKI